VKDIVIEYTGPSKRWTKTSKDRLMCMIKHTCVFNDVYYTPHTIIKTLLRFERNRDIFYARKVARCIYHNNIWYNIRQYDIINGTHL